MSRTPAFDDPLAICVVPGRKSRGILFATSPQTETRWVGGTCSPAIFASK